VRVQGWSEDAVVQEVMEAVYVFSEAGENVHAGNALTCVWQHGAMWREAVRGDHRSTVPPV
jgi:hypothetical protein